MKTVRIKSGTLAFYGTALLILTVIGSVIGTGWKKSMPAGRDSLLVQAPSPAAAPARPVKRPVSPVRVLPDNPWADSILATMTLDEKIGQLFMLAAFSNRSETEYRATEKLIRDYHIGGLIFFQGGPGRQAALTNRYQAASRIPLFIGIDGEWGLGMRLDSTIAFPYQMTLGAVRDDSLVYRMGAEIGRQCRRLGIHINFAPVTDINSNPQNPVIGFRSFGEIRENVAAKAIAYMKGLQHTGIIATAKHFPGHGDSESDSHHTLPVIRHSPEKLRDTDLYPYRKMIADSLMGVLNGHLYVPGIDSTPSLASSLSDKVVTDLLKKEMGFRGLVFTDAMNMKGVLRSGKAQEVNLKALIAGNDVLLYPESIKETIQLIRSAVQRKVVSEKMIDDKVLRILKAKYWAGLHQLSPVSTDHLYEDLNTGEAQYLKRELSEASVTAVRNLGNLLPLQLPSTGPIASVTLGGHTRSTFQKVLDRYAFVSHFAFSSPPSTAESIQEMLRLLAPYRTVVIAVHGITSSPDKNHGITPGETDFVRQLIAQNKKTVLCLFGTPYSIRYFGLTDALICANQDGNSAQEATGEVIFGARSASGIMPVSALSYNAGHGIRTQAVGRLGYAIPENVNMNSRTLSRIDQVAREGIAAKAFPGCQIVVARKGKIVYDKNFGGTVYKSQEKVSEETLYDLASVTKVAGTLQGIMLLYDQKLVELDQKVSYYLPELNETNKQDFTVRDLLLHRAGLLSWYPPLWEKTVSNGVTHSYYYSQAADSLYSVQVAPGFYTRPAIRDSVWKWIVQTPLHGNRDRSRQTAYTYSDLGFVMLQKIIERVTGKPLDSYLEEQFYIPMGLSRLLFNPLRYFPPEQVAPTAQDNKYRGQLIRGTVHDQMAALVGGVSGHAGLFGNAINLASLLQMNLQKGSYAGRQYLQPGTVTLFSRLQDEAYHRGLGWDKPNGSGNSSYVSPMASAASYGHTGFTGNVVWVDPEKEIVFIFLSNRVYPSADNNSINSLKLRRRIHDIVYESVVPESM